MSAAWRIAIRELSGGLRGFWIYLACITLGVAAISSAGSVTEVFTRGLAGEARMLLGGDAMFAVNQRRLTDDERAYAESLGDVTEKITLTVMGTAGDLRRQVDLTGIDDAFPLVGEMELSGDIDTTFDQQGELWGAAVSQSFLNQFDAAIGDEINLGPVRAEIRARLDRLPDQIGTPGSFGPEAVVSIRALEAADRLGVGQLFRTRLIVSANTELPIRELREAFDESFPEANVRIRGPENAVDGLQELLQTLNDFLSIIGIAALIAGGIGVEQATTSFLQSRTSAIAALKSLGAESGLIRTAYTIQLGALALLGGALGLIIGAAAPYLMVSFAGDQIALPQALAIYPIPLITALALGLLSAGFFAIPAIGRARATPPSALFRNLSEESRTRTPLLERSLSHACLAGFVLLSTLSSSRPMITLALLAGTAIIWGAFLLTAWLIKRAAKPVADNSRGLTRLAFSNISGPGSLASAIVPSLGIGLALLSLVVAVQANLLRQIQETAPANAPSLVFTQIPGDRAENFDELIEGFGVDIDDSDAYRRAPFLLVRITELNGVPTAEAEIADSERWAVRGETNVTFLGPEPEGGETVEGEWWAEDYSGRLLVSVEEGAARGLGLSPGSTIGLRVFGRDLTAEVAAIRRVEWGTFDIGSNTAFIFSPGILEAANPSHVAIARTDGREDRALISALKDNFAGVVVFETRPALEAASKIFDDIALAVNAAASVVTIAGLLVLMGTLGVMTQKRAVEAALLKTFGAARSQIFQLYALEFSIAGGIAAMLGALIGIAAAYPIIVTVFEARWSIPYGPVGVILIAALGISVLGGLFVARSVLAKPAARVLRDA